MKSLNLVKNNFFLSVILVCLAACNGERTSEHVNTAGSEAASVDSAVQDPNPGKTPDYNPSRNAYFGELHVHTQNSFDAYYFNSRATPEDVYRFARGESLQHPAGYPIQLSGPPLDFAAVTDHGVYLGIIPAMDSPGTSVSKHELAKGMFQEDREKAREFFSPISRSVREGVPLPGLADQEIMDSAWARTVRAADEAYVPGKLTTFAAYEFTSVATTRSDAVDFGGGNLHRNVIFRGEAPERIFTVHDSKNPEDLWNWLDAQRDAGREVLAIPHNSNVSDGRMFASDTYAGEPLTAAYSTQRMRNEPLVEITQVKGTSETHPELSPNDEWSNFEIYESLLATTTRSRVPGGYVREAYANGLSLEEQGLGNPFKFGVIGSSDNHFGAGPFDEKNFWSKMGTVDSTPELRGSVPPNGAKSWDGVTLPVRAELWYTRWSASGLAGVWAEENTREAIFDAMRRKETFATSGPRIRVRFFGGYDFDESLLSSTELAAQAYKLGVPMGGDLIGEGGRAPRFLVWAMRDPNEALLDRVQIIKTWSENGVRQERVIDVACADGRAVDPETRRCGAGVAEVDLQDCSISEGGAPELKALWRDPDFVSSSNAVYYVRVLQVPTCRWSTWDAIRAGVPPNPNLHKTIQERAWSSPIWYVPG